MISCESRIEAGHLSLSDRQSYQSADIGRRLRWPYLSQPVWLEFGTDFLSVKRIPRYGRSVRNVLAAELPKPRTNPNTMLIAQEPRRILHTILSAPFLQHLNRGLA